MFFASSNSFAVIFCGDKITLLFGWPEACFPFGTFVCANRKNSGDGCYLFAAIFSRQPMLTSHVAEFLFSFGVASGKRAQPYKVWSVHVMPKYARIKISYCMSNVAGFFVMYTHMFRQRKKVLGKTTQTSTKVD